VAYRKVVSPTPSELLSEGQFRLFAVCARRPQNLPREVPWQERGPGVYDCLWGTDTVRVVVAGELPREVHNAPLHLFSASPVVVGFGGGAYRRRSEDTSRLLDQLFRQFRGEGLIMPYTMADFRRDYVKEHLSELTPQELAEALQALPAEARLAGLPAEARLAGLSLEEIREYLDRATAGPKAPPRKPRRKK